MSEIDPCTAYDAALEEMSVLKAKVAKLEAEKADMLQQARQVSGLLAENGALRADKATLVEALKRITSGQFGIGGALIIARDVLERVGK